MIISRSFMNALHTQTHIHTLCLIIPRNNKKMAQRTPLLLTFLKCYSIEKLAREWTKKNLRWRRRRRQQQRRRRWHTVGKQNELKSVPFCEKQLAYINKQTICVSVCVCLCFVFGHASWYLYSIFIHKLSHCIQFTWAFGSFFLNALAFIV